MTILVKDIAELRKMRSSWRMEGKTVGVVPTMGYLHKGHQSLIETARSQNDVVVVTDFLNPIQFGPSEDLSKYPRDLEKDFELVESNGADVLFYPSVKEMYGDDFSEHAKSLTMVVPPIGLSSKLCGAKRPGHFEGVCTVVAKIFNIAEPERAYFGQKDAQQLNIIKRMVKDTNRNVEIVGCPTFREADGLAMSSRNVYLNQAERSAAQVLYKALVEADSRLKSGQNDAHALVEYVKEVITSEPLAKIDYVSLVNPDTLEDLEIIETPALLAIAVFIGEDVHRTRLIDNIVLHA
ncbi:MAG: pantoate--beta-alanine ligase [Candidatus Ancillula sp.]|jgi:pantoate--beta-alanine ligase|nr:pantoate--beta-alanine ligase [Candidatus Ancillula sp.]